MSLGRSPLDRSRLEEWSLLVLAVLVALTFLRAEGTPDIPIWFEWTRRALRLGLAEGYADLKIDYPPLFLTILYWSALAAKALGSTLFVGLKASLLLALLASAFVYGRMARSVGSATALLFALIPCSVGLGYLDVLYAPLFLAAFHALEREGFGTFGALYALSCLVKWQPLVIAPLILIYLWKRNPRAVLRAGAAGAISVLALFAFFGPEMVRALGRGLSHRGLSLNALNLWWLVTHALHALWPDVFGALNAGTAGHVYSPYGVGAERLVLRLPFLLGYGAVVASLWRHPPHFETFVRHALVGFLAYFMLATGAHENHSFVAVLLAAVLALHGPEGRRAFLIWAALFNANLWVFYGITGRLPMSRVLGLDLAIPLALLNLWFFALALLSLKDERRPPVEGGVGATAMAGSDWPGRP